MDTNQIRQAYLDFFTDKVRNHKKIPSVSLVPKDDPTTLFTGSGMQQLVPYLKGKSHPMGKRLVNSQPCFRAEDIDEVGDNRHTTFFEMLGNWSLGDYFKEDQLTWFWEFLTKVLKLPQDKLYVSVFQGDKKDVPKDEDSIKIWKKLGIPEKRIHSYPAEKNWWSRGGTPKNMPSGIIGGTTSEVFFEFTQVDHDPKFGKKCHPNCDCGRFIEIGNSVFMEYEKQSDGSLKPLPKKNVDFGGGLERLAMTTQNTSDMFQIDIFKPIIKEIENVTAQKYEGKNKSAMRIIADHLRAATFMIKEGLEPSNKQQGYVLRRLIRRSAVKFRQLTGELKPDSFNKIINESVFTDEIKRFAKSLDKGFKESEKFDPNIHVDANLFAFNLFQTYSFPFEVSKEILEKKGAKLDIDKFNKIFKSHRDLSRTASVGMFKGGLKDQSGASIKLHTATHLLHQALRQVLGDHVKQVGSNITPERLRFDFTHSDKLTDDQVDKITTIINKQIKADLKVTSQQMDYDQAIKTGALAFFGERYPDKVTVYSINNYSQEVCAGPHVSSTAEIGGVRIIKQESSGANKRRIYAVLKNGTKKSARQIKTKTRKT